MDLFSNLPTEVFWLFLSGITFLVITILFLLGPWRREKSVLMTAFLGWLAGMALFHLFGGASMLWGNPILMYLAAFFAVTGSTFVAKFPLLSIRSRSLQNMLFYAVMALAWVLVLWLIITGADPMTSMTIASEFMIVFSGISGFYMVIRGYFFKDPALRIKCLGGGCSIWLCCFLTHLIVITVGMIALAKLFMILTPIMLIMTVYLARKYATQSQPPPTPQPITN